MQDFLAVQAELARHRLVNALYRLETSHEKLLEVLVVEVVTTGAIAAFSVTIRPDGLDECAISAIKGEIGRIACIPLGPLRSWSFQKGGSMLHSSQADCRLEELADSLRPVVVQSALRELQKLLKQEELCDPNLIVRSDIESLIKVTCHYVDARDRVTISAETVNLEGLVEAPVKIPPDKWTDAVREATSLVEIDQARPCYLEVRTINQKLWLCDVADPRLV